METSILTKTTNDNQAKILEMLTNINETLSMKNTRTFANVTIADKPNFEKLPTDQGFRPPIRNFQNFSGNRTSIADNNRNRQFRPREPEFNEKHWCWFHYTYGPNARNCKQGCRYTPNNVVQKSYQPNNFSRPNTGNTGYRQRFDFGGRNNSSMIRSSSFPR